MFIASLAAVALSQSLTDSVRLIRYPDVHGDKVVFVYASDLWIVEGQNGVARRLTSHPGLETYPKFSPDGTKIAFTGQYHGTNDVYVIPTTGGEPTRLTFEPTSEIVREWTPDGRKIAYVSSYGNFTDRMPRLWMVPAQGGMPERTDLAEAFDLSFSPDGTKLAYNRKVSHVYNWRHYRGGTQGKISFWDFNAKTYTEVPADREQNYFPMWVGDTVFYVSDKNNRNLNLYAYNTKNKRTEQITKFTDGDIRWPSTDGKSIVFERNLRLHRMDIQSRQITTLDPRVTGDNVQMLPRYHNLSRSVGGWDLSPTAKRVVVEARGDIFSVPATNGETRNLTDSDGVREKDPAWSSDGRYIYYLTDRSGEWKIARRDQMGNGGEEVIPTPNNHRIQQFQLSPDAKSLMFSTIGFELYVMPIDGGSPKLVYQDNALPARGTFSPDGKWIAYSKTLPNLLTAICLYDVDAGREHQITQGVFGDASPTFDQTGKYLYFISARDYAPGIGMAGPHLEQTSDIQRVYVVSLDASLPNPLIPEGDEEPITGEQGGQNPPAGQQPPAASQEPPRMKVDLEFIESRMVALPYPVGSYYALMGTRNGVIVVGSSGVTMFSLRSRQVTPIMPLVEGLALSKDGSKFAYKVGPVIGISDIRPNVQPGTGAVNFNRVGRVVDPRKEFKQMFWDVWRYERDQFYDENMLGVNWKAVGDKYAALLPDVGDRSDLDYVIGQLIGELGTGHAYVQPGPGSGDPLEQAAGLLGADYVAEGNHIKIAKVYRGVSYVPSSVGPLGAIGLQVNDGEYLLEIDGKPVTSQEGVTPHLIGKVGHKVTITVNSTPTLSGARKLEVYPTVSESRLRYETWVEERRQMVDKLSGGKIGYLHVPDTNVQGMIMFLRGFFSQTDKQAWVIDERYNGGGWIPTFFINYLTAQTTSVFAPRHGVDQGMPIALNGPKAMLINEHAGSGGDLFPYLFKKAEIGPLIGKRTWGGLVGIQGYYNLVGGGGVTAPGFAIYDPDSGKYIAENTGVDPDIEVEDDPALAARGQDPQLERAVNWLLDQLKNPRKEWKTPAAPRIDG